MKARNGVTERNGVRLGQRVVDVEGNALGRVDELYDTGFSVVKGLPILFRTDFVAGYDEVRELRGDELVLARSKRDLFDLARGEIPPSWRIAAPPGLPSAATPSEEARLAAAQPRGAEPRKPS